MQANDDIKTKLILAGQILVAEGQDDFTRGHISCRVPGRTDAFYMKAHSIGLDEITLDNILTLDLEGEIVEGTAKRHSERFIHTEIYKARPDVQAILHTHPNYATALSATGRPLRASSQPGALFKDALTVYDDTINLIRSPEMGAGVARALADARAVLLRNHGIVCTGASIEEVVIGAIMLENAAMIQMLCDATGQAGPEFSPEDIAKLKHDISRPEQFTINFDYLARRVRRRAPAA